MAISEWQILFNKLVLAKIHCNPTAICYCENKQDAQNTDTKEIKFLSAKSHDFGKLIQSIKNGSYIISNKLIANALITQKAPSDTPHDDDLD